MVRPAQLSRSRLRSGVLAGALAGVLVSAGTIGSMAGASAATKGGVTMDDTRQVEGKTLILNGIGLRSFTILHIRGYVAGLYLLKKATTDEAVLDEPNPKALFIQFIHAASADRVHTLYVDSSKAYCAAHTCTEKDRAAFLQLLDSVQAVAVGDRTGFIVTDAGVQVLHNDKVVTNIPDPAFGRTILDSDVGTTAASAELRDELLGLPTD